MIRPSLTFRKEKIEGKNKELLNHELEQQYRIYKWSIDAVLWVLQAHFFFFFSEMTARKNTQAQQEQEQTDKLNKQFGLIYIGYVGSNAPNNIAIHRISGDNL